jgi:hypothetical protein
MEQSEAADHSLGSRHAITETVLPAGGGPAGRSRLRGAWRISRIPRPQAPSTRPSGTSGRALAASQSSTATARRPSSTHPWRAPFRGTVPLPRSVARTLPFRNRSLRSASHKTWLRKSAIRSAAEQNQWVSKPGLSLRAATTRVVTAVQYGQDQYPAASDNVELRVDAIQWVEDGPCSTPSASLAACNRPRARCRLGLDRRRGIVWPIVADGPDTQGMPDRCCQSPAVQMVDGRPLPARSAL